MLSIFRKFILIVVLNTLKLLATIAMGLGKQKKISILIYHRVLDEPDFMRPGEIDKAAFSWQMELIANYFNVLPLKEALEKLQTNSLPPRAVCITFDDGYADNFLNALPILTRFRLSATFFIASGYLNGGRMWNDSIIESIRILREPELNLSEIKLDSYDVSNDEKKAITAARLINTIKHLDPTQRQKYSNLIAQRVDNLPDNLMLNTEQLINLHQAGMEIGGHTVTHPIMAKIKGEVLKKEISENKEALESILDTEIKFFAYPNGKPKHDYLEDQIEVIKENNYQAALTTVEGVASVSNDIWQLPRFTPWDKTPVKFMARLVMNTLHTAH